MQRFAGPIPAHPAKRASPHPAAPQPRRAGPQRGPLWHAIQLKAARSASAGGAKAETGSGLPAPLKAGIERLSGLAMDDVRVHRNSAQPARFGAHAYTQGRDIHVGPGQERHLPHEAWHVVQQKQGRVKPTMQMHGAVPVNDDAGLEREADVMGTRALDMAPAPPTDAAGISGAPLQRRMAEAVDAPVVQRLRFSNSNSFYGPPVDISRLTQQQALAVAAQLPETAFTEKVTMVNLPGVGLQWVEISSADVERIAFMAGLYRTRDRAEESDTDHGAESPVKEEKIEWDELTDTGLKRLPGQVLYNIFLNLALPRLKDAGQKVPAHMETIYLQWRFGGVYTRGQLDNLLGIPAKSGQAMQMARSGDSWSYNTSYTGNNTGTNYTDVVYYRDAGGNIDFSVNPATVIGTYNKYSGEKIAASSIVWSNPLVPASHIQMSTDLKDPTKGVMPSGTSVNLPKASRSQHFAIADMLYPNSRSGKLTWHHLNPHYEMVLVDMRVHAKHGHNGGVYLWT